MLCQCAHIDDSKYKDWPGDVKPTTYIPIQNSNRNFELDIASEMLCNGSMETQKIYLIVGKKIRPAQARIIGKIAEVRTEYGIREFGKFFLTEEDARLAMKKGETKC